MFDRVFPRQFTLPPSPPLRSALRSMTSVVLLTDIYDIIRRKMMLLQGNKAQSYATPKVANPSDSAPLCPPLSLSLTILLPAVISFALQAAKILLNCA